MYVSLIFRDFILLTIIDYSKKKKRDKRNFVTIF